MDTINVGGQIHAKPKWLDGFVYFFKTGVFLSKFTFYAALFFVGLSVMEGVDIAFWVKWFYFFGGFFVIITEYNKYRSWLNE
jgi:hypothetical protein